MNPISLMPGPEGTRVPDGLSVLRLGSSSTLNQVAIDQLTGDKTSLIGFFELSSDDKRQSTPRLSVWVEGLTTVEQAWVLVGQERKRRIVLKLQVDRIRELRPQPPEPPHPGLDVEWEPASRPDGYGGRMPEDRPGAEGHAGVARLDNAHGTKSQRKYLRTKLADLAVVRILDDTEIDRIVALLPPPVT